jgi:aspartyl-tRNA(Asn)/glutamyl-tRNA(Gln) amidotransferase subunit C
MSLDNKQVKEIAYLARLSVDDTQLEQSTEELNNILNIMEELGEIETGDIEPMAHPLHMSQRLREDEVSVPLALCHLSLFRPALPLY